MSDISHEIRTPLNILQNNLEAMIDEVFPVTKERLVPLNDEVIRFGNLLNNLNALKEFETEEIPLKCEAIDINEIVYSVSQDFAPVLIDKKIKLNYKINTEEKNIIIGDKDKIKQVFINIISNSVKFNKENGEISLKVSKSKQI